MAILLAGCVTAFLVAFIVLPVIIKYSLAKKLGDIPGKRKIHKKVTPSLGGIAIFAGFTVSLAIWIDFTRWYEVHYILASLAIVFLIGVRDDLVPFRAIHKLYGQIVAILILMFSSITITSFYGLFGINDIPTWIGYVLSVLFLILITNAFNLIDGLDGLAGSVGLVALMAFGFWFFWIGDSMFALFCFALVGGILAFLVYNWQPAEIFMGDTGAMVIGMMLGILTIRFLGMNDSLPSAHPAHFEAPIASAACFLIVPLCDTLRIIVLRISKGHSPFQPDKSHIHHAIMRLGYTHGRTAVILASVHLLFIVASFLLRETEEMIKLGGVVVTAALLSFVLDKLITRKLSARSSHL